MTVVALTRKMSIRLFISLIYVFEKDYYLIITKTVYFYIASKSNGTTLDPVVHPVSNPGGGGYSHI